MDRDPTERPAPPARVLPAPSPAPPVTAGDVLTLDELRDLQRTSSWRGAGLVLHAWLTIAAAGAACILWPTALTFLVAVVVIGSRQLGLMMLAHEAAHWRLFPNARANDRVGRWLCAGPVGVDLKTYRREHHLHHRHTLRADDPELGLAAPFPVSQGQLWRAALADLGGWTAARLAVAALSRRGPASAAWRRLRAPLVGQAVLLAALAAAGHWACYPLLWLLPLVTWYRLLARLRTLAEHAMVPDDGDPLRNSRTTGAGPLARAFLAPYWMNHHLEHHLLVFVPCWKLGRAHALLLAKGYGARMEIAPGYVDVIRRAAGARAGTA